MTANVSPACLASELIGTPYLAGGQDASGFECWGLVRYFYRHAYGTPLKDFSHIYPRDLKATSAQFEAAAESIEWQQIEKPECGCVVAMSRSKVLHHVGIWLEIDGGLCLHALDGYAVVAQTIGQLKQQHFSKILFFKHGQGIQNKQPV